MESTEPLTLELAAEVTDAVSGDCIVQVPEVSLRGNVSYPRGMTVHSLYKILRNVMFGSVYSCSGGITSGAKHFTVQGPQHLCVCGILSIPSKRGVYRKVALVEEKVLLSFV